MSMSVLKNRRLLIGIASLVIIVGAAAAIWGVPKFLKRSTSVKGQVSTYLLDDRGAVNGLLLATGDQLSFSPETGAVVASQIKVGDEVSAVGHPGSQSNYGREIRVEQITANGHTIVAVHDGPRHKPERDHAHGPKDRGDRGDREGRGDRLDRGDRVGRAGPPEQSPDRAAEKTATTTPGPQTSDVDAASPDGTAPPVAPTPKPTPEIIKATATIRAHLVNARGDVDGLILSSGEQVRFSPKVGKLIVAAEQGSTTQVSVEGPGVRNERGVVIRPTVIAVGNQTIALDN